MMDGRRTGAETWDYAGPLEGIEIHCAPNEGCAYCRDGLQPNRVLRGRDGRWYKSKYCRVCGRQVFKYGGDDDD